MILERNMFVQYRAINEKKYLAKDYDAYELDEIGEIVWENIDGNTPLEEIAEKIAVKYDVDKNIVMRDIEEFAKEMIDKGLVEEVIS